MNTYFKGFKEGKEIENNEFDFNIDLKDGNMIIDHLHQEYTIMKFSMKTNTAPYKKANLKCWKVKLSYQMCL